MDPQGNVSSGCWPARRTSGCASSPGNPSALTSALERHSLVRPSALDKNRADPTTLPLPPTQSRGARPLDRRLRVASWRPQQRESSPSHDRLPRPPDLVTTLSTHERSLTSTRHA